MKDADGKLDVGQGDDINLFEYWCVIKKRKKVIAGIVGGVTLIVIIVSLFLPKIYKAEAVIMPLGGGGGGGMGVASQLGNLPMVGGVLSGAMMNPLQKFMALLRTKKLAEMIINQNDLMKVFYKDEWDEKNNRWKDGFDEKVSTEEAITSLSNGQGYVVFEEKKRDGIIVVAANFEEPELAAQVANSYVESLQDLINKSAFTLAKRNRIFIEGQLVQNKRDLLEIGRELNEFYKAGRVSDVESRVDVLLGVANEYNFGRVDQVIKYVNASGDTWTELEDVKNKLMKKLEETKVVKNVPQQVYLQYLTLRQELFGKINGLLTQQYEMSKIEEAKEDLAFEIIDPARVPVGRDKPRRRQMVMIAFGASLFAAIFLVFLLEHFQRMKNQYKKSI